jgi:hypothetical protein
MGVAGTHNIQFNSPGGKQAGNLTLEANEGSLSGTYVTGKTTQKLTDGKVNGDEVEFAYVQTTPVGKMKVVFKGKVAGDEISGQVKLGGPFGSSAFTGKRV